MKTKKYISLIMVLATMSSFALIVPAFAVTNQQDGGNKSEQGQSPVVMGTVSAISGTTITVVGKQVPGNATTTTVFTVNAVNSQVLKGNTVITLSSIVVGDTITVQGTIIGANVLATVIRDGKVNEGDNNGSNEINNDFNKMFPDVVGKVSTISGNILTVISSRDLNKTEASTTTTFIVDVTNAKLLRGNTVITLSDIVVGDTVIVQGTVNGTNVVATMVRDGKVGNGNGNKNDNNQALLQIQGNGQPIVAGTISAISGSTITITNSSNITYIIDATSAKILQGKNTILLSGVKIGDSIIVQGTVSGTSVIASTIIDTNSKHFGFFGSMGQFFKRLFGF